uniref:Uncharacterized protein n=1 Tax=Trichogramma kaykai TaxID=54128 RepID=A0ABD2WG40_9HYME
MCARVTLRLYLHYVLDDFSRYTRFARKRTGPSPIAGESLCSSSKPISPLYIRYTCCRFMYTWIYSRR